MNDAIKKDSVYFMKTAVSGSIAAFITHVGLVPLDVIKTRMQINPILYPSMKGTTRIIVSKEGLGALLLGLGPTFYGYAAQGALKYGLYEYFKGFYSHLFALAENPRHTKLYASGIYLMAGMTGEMIADLALSPMEAIRIRLVSQPTYTKGTLSGLSRLYSEEGILGWYRGLVPLVLKQVPYTAVKFCVFEGSLKLIDDILPKKRADLNKLWQLSVTFIAGLIGGMASAVASHPADTLLTAVNMQQQQNINSTRTLSTTTSHLSKPTRGIFGVLRNALKTLGWLGLWRGIFPRMGMVGLMAASQLLIYDASKVFLFGLPVTQGLPEMKKPTLYISHSG